MVRVLTLLLLGVCCMAGVFAADLFQKVDKNVDGSIDRTEFK